MNVRHVSNGFIGICEKLTHRERFPKKAFEHTGNLANNSRHLLSALEVVLKDKIDSHSGKCRGGIKNKDLCLWSRRGLLANVSVGVSVQLKP